MRTLSLLVLFSLLTAFVRANPVEDSVKAKTPFKDFSLAQVEKGDVLVNREGLSQTPMVEAIQTCFLIKASVGTVTSTLVNWNPAGKSGLDVTSHQVLDSSVSADSFQSKLGPFLSGSKGGGWIAKQSHDAKDSSCELMLNDGEKSLLAATKTPDALLHAWGTILAKRYASFRGKGAADFSSLLSAVRQIGPLEVSSPSGGTYYWELSDLDGRGSISEGVTWQDGSRVCDGEFFVTSEYTASFDVSTLWPVTVDGKSATLVWRIDSALSPQFADLKGAERIASGSLVLSSVKKAIEAIRQKAEK
jgi:hypothetical protein